MGYDSAQGHDDMADGNDLTLILAMLGQLQTTTEAGLAGVNARLDKLNGRVAANESMAATLNERTSKMVCVSHAGLLGQLESDVKTLKEAPVKSATKSVAITGTVVASVMAIVEGIAMWMRSH
jgi:hypothetical protein